MAGRNSRKRSAPARLREELWYLVDYEDDCTLRVLPEDEIRHIFHEEEEEEIQTGDIVSALWLPNGQYYDAKVLKKGSDKNELMKERLKLEKANRNSGKEAETTQAPKVQQKRKNPKDTADRQKKKKKTKDQTQSDGEMQQKEKEKEEKKKKKEEEQTRQEFLLQARKAHAAQRWSSTDSDLTIISPVNAAFRPEPLHRPNRPSTHLTSLLDNETLSPLAVPSTSAHKENETPARTNTCAQTSRPTTPALQADKTPARKATKSKHASESVRRGLLQSAACDSSEDDSDDEEDREHDVTDCGSSASCCKEMKLENEALRKRLEKVHKRLNIALKAKTVEEVVKNRPAAGILDTALAVEYKMVEVMEGSGAYWYSHQRAYCSAFKQWPGYINAAIDIFFKKETLAASSAMGNEKKSKNGSGHPPLNPVIIKALIGKVCSKFSKECPTPSPSQIVQKINMKCVEARRPPRIHATPTR